ncbi:hypothetical protein BC833DRAFT_623840 [Globomyces pollinis-pini]|nr:hypothetical protein BC833DRAFT_623840 [Globomyces pollinis-pini]
MLLHTIEGEEGRLTDITFRGRYNQVLSEYISVDKYNALVDELNAEFPKDYSFVIKYYSVLGSAVIMFIGLFIALYMFKSFITIFLVYPLYFSLGFALNWCSLRQKQALKHRFSNFADKYSESYSDNVLTFAGRHTDFKYTQTRWFFEFHIPSNESIIYSERVNHVVDIDPLPEYEHPPEYISEDTEMGERDAAEEAAPEVLLESVSESVNVMVGSEEVDIPFSDNPPNYDDNDTSIRIPDEVEDINASNQAEGRETPNQVEDNEASNQAESREAPPQIEDNEASNQAESREAPPQIEDNDTSNQAEGREAPPQIEDNETSNQVEDRETPNQVEDNELSKEGEDNESAARIPLDDHVATDTSVRIVDQTHL